MEGIQNFFQSVSKDAQSAYEYASSSSRLSEISSKINEAGGGSAKTALATTPSSSYDPSRVLVNRHSGRAISVMNCTKLCGFFFVAGVIVGYTLKRRVRRWASRLLRRLKDD